MGIILHFRGDFEYLSNFAPSIILAPTLEHHFQAAKATNSKDYTYVMCAETPGEAKKRGRQIVIRKDWNDVRLSIMQICITRKFLQDNFRTKLIATKGMELIEGNYWHDNYWGYCLCDKCSETTHLNHLGRILMSERSAIIKCV